MALTTGQAVAAVIVMALVTYLTRALPFLLFGRGGRPPKPVLYLGRVLPPAIIAMLIVYCLRDTTFSLPAGRYQSLRVTLGEGAGHNWWCVVFPPLCLTAAESEAAFEELDGETRAIISSDGGGVQFKFRLLELWGELMELLGA